MGKGDTYTAHDGGQFLLLTCSSADFAHPGLAVASARAGATACIDVEFSADADGSRHLAQLLAAVPGRSVGLRLGRRAPHTLPLTLDVPRAAQTFTFVLSATGSVPLAERIAALPTLPGREIMVEVISVDELATCADLPVDAIIGVGNEAGGYVGEDASFILFQKLRRSCRLPLLMRGGVGVNNAAAFRVAGAAGVVLDEQLLLLKESPLSPAFRAELEQANGQDTRVLAEREDAGRCRVLLRPRMSAARALEARTTELETGEIDLAAWNTLASATMGWGEVGDKAWPLGQAIGLARHYGTRYRSCGRLLAAIDTASSANIQAAALLQPLAAGAPLAASHGTRYPLAQGPMTRVSDSARFAKAVAEGGALPFLALALMNGKQVLELLQETRALLPNLPWGVGLLGFVPHQLRQEQLEAVWQSPPDFALIAGGRPDQAIEFEQRGVPAYIHVPVPELLKIFIDQGARRFVFEGRECGGHIGPLASTVLWEAMIEALLEALPAGAEEEVHVLFAGGLHDAVTGAMLSAMTAPLAARGVRVGALMGSAYLFTPELVDSGAVVPGFQEAAVQCTRTSNLETGVGHVTRCASTTFCDEFFDRRVTLLKARAAAEDIREELEDLNLGRLRIAAKGQDRRGAGGAIVNVPEADQAREGMYMIGQVATLRSERITIPALHEDISTASLALLEAAQAPVVERAQPSRPPADIAIVGIGTLLPGAQDAETFWENLVNLKSAIREIPLERWDWRLYFDEDRQKPDRIYSKWGGFLDEVPFDPLSFGIPPKSIKSIDTLQLLALEVVRRALADAGFSKADYERDDTAVILGASGGLGDLGLQYGLRSELMRFVDHLPEEVWQRLPEWTEESFAGTLLNVIAGRIANRFNFGGVNFTVDAACASSLAAVNLAVNELVEGRSYIAIAGGVDTVQSPFGFMCFSKTQALSPKGKARTFDATSDGIVISEGLATIVMKRLADAERDGDRIYAVIKAVGGSSDGKALGLTAPLPEGQMRALHRAYRQAGFSPATLGMIEAHGTGTAVGDRAEAETIVRVLRQADAAARSTAIGSLKTLIGHTKATAGISGLIKVALALHHQVLPAHAGVEKPIEIIAKDDSPVYLLPAPRPWFKPAGHPRRGAASSFGFGGTNFHAVLEEYANGYLARQGALGARNWPCELFVLGAPDPVQLGERLRQLKAALAEGARPPLRDLAYSLALQEANRGRQASRLALVASDLADLEAKLDQALKLLEAGTPCPAGGDIQFMHGTEEAGKLAFLFPGQGAQYPNMCRELALYLPEFRDALEQAEALFLSLCGDSLLTRIYPPGAFDDASRQAQIDALTATHFAQPAIGALSAACFDFATRLGLRADMVAGHSFGEYSALHAAGYLDRDAFYTLAAIRGRTMAEACNAAPAGGMAAVSAERAAVEAAIRAFPGLVVANHNALRQVVISGPAEAIDAAITAFGAQGMSARRLPVAGAFHSPLVATAQGTLSAAIAAASVSTPQLPVYGNRDGQRYPTDATSVRAILDEHMLSPVEFVRQLETMHDDGARVFVEIGPKSILCGLAGQTLEGRAFSTVALDAMNGSLRGCLAGLARLHALGVGWNPAALFEARDCHALDLRHLARDWTMPAPGKTAWFITGGGARTAGETVVKTGKLPTLTLEAVRAAEAVRDADAARLVAANTPAPQAPAAIAPAQTVVQQTPPAAVMAPSAAAAPAPVQPALAAPRASAAELGSLLAGYHQTMQEFLRVQESVVSRYLGTATHSTSGLTAPLVAPAPAPAHPAVVHVAPAMVPAAPPAPVLPPLVAAPAPAPQPTSPAAAAPPTPAVITAPAAAAAVSAPPAGIDRAQFTRILLEVISDRTGYPEDMLGLDLDLEAELGVDSIKRVEILGALQQRLPEPLARAMQAQMETLTRLKTLSALLDALVATGATVAPAASVAPVAAPAAVPAAVVAAAAPALDRAALTRTLLEVISDRTGYPEDMLGLDLDLEAELGVDSIKRVEILGALQQRLPETAARAMQAQMETLTRLKTLSALLEAIPVAAPAAAGATADVVSLVPAVAVASAPAEGMDRGELTRILLEVISDRTGYPEDMLGLDLDLEAELGVDSIKRVEILGALQQRLPEATARAMQAQMETLTRLKTLTALLDQLGTVGGAAPAHAALGSAAAVAGAAAQAVVSSPAASPAISTAGSLERGALTRTLLEVISDRTGYPEDMLGLDLDLEAELGVDSIKRVEILGALQQRLPESSARAMQAQMETLTRLKTLTALLDALTADAAAPAVAAAAAPQAPLLREVPRVETSEPQALPTYIMRGEARPLPTRAPLAAKGLVLVTGDSPLTTAVIDDLTARGATAVAVSAATLAEGTALAGWLDNQRARHGSVRGLIHLGALDDTRWPSDITQWRELAARQVKTFFTLMQACLPDFRVSNGTAPRVLAAIAIDGRFGRSGQATDANPLGGAITGLFKTLAWEVPGVRARMLDLAPRLDAATRLATIVDEYLGDHDDVEIGHDGTARTVWYPQEVRDDCSRPGLTPDASWVVLVTGGARGITNHVAREVLRPGMRLVVVGRTPPPDEEPAATANLPDDNRSAFRAHFLAQAKAAGRRTTPAEVESQIDGLLRDREIRSNMRDLPKAGVSCEYHACDVTDATHFGQLIDGIYERYGRLDAVFHGAGRNEDKLIEDKTADSFARIFDTKADSSYILAQHLKPESLRLLVFFTSVAGRFGNRGQADYAAANEVVNRIAWTLSARWPQVMVCALNWGPWDNTGMVTDEIKRQFRERGIEAITPEQGRRWIAGLFGAGVPADVELVLGAGPWAAMSAAPVTDMPRHQSRLVLIDDTPAIKPNGSLELTHGFSAGNDPYLIDHRLDGKLVLPVTGAAEWFAQVVQAGWPDWHVAEVRDLSVLKGFTFNPDETRIASFIARPSSHASADELHVSVEMRDNEKRSVHYRGTVILRRELPAAAGGGMGSLTPGVIVSPERAYSDYLFHGPSFRLICEAANVTEAGVDARARPSTPAAWLNGRLHGEAQNWLLDPGLLDTAPQLAIIWSRMHFDETALPSRIGGIRRFGGWKPNGPLHVALRVAPDSTAAVFKYDVDFTLDDGTLALRMESVESSRSAALNRLAGQHGR